MFTNKLQGKNFDWRLVTWVSTDFNGSNAA